MDAKTAKDLHFYEPKNGHGLKHDPFNAIIGPRPIGWISSRDSKGNINLAPYSFFNGFASNLKLPRSYQWNVALEKSFSAGQVISATYVGQSGIDLLRSEAERMFLRESALAARLGTDAAVR